MMVGEVSVHLPVLDLQDGEHVACCRLVNDTAEFEELEHTISFWVRHDCVETDRGWRRRELSVLHEREAEVDEAEEEITLRFQTIMTDECEESDACKSDEDCNKHGTCVRGGCLCESDWAGETCQHAILSQMRFLPDRDPSASPSRCIKVALLSSDSLSSPPPLLASCSRSSPLSSCDFLQAIAWEQGVDLLRKRSKHQEGGGQDRRGWREQREEGKGGRRRWSGCPTFVTSQTSTWTRSKVMTEEKAGG
eukprot:606373-Hanusia_phi.AAC.1